MKTTKQIITSLLVLVFIFSFGNSFADNDPRKQTAVENQKNTVQSVQNEAEMPIENWMADDNYFEQSATQSAEKEIEIEGWMSDENYFKQVWEYEQPEAELEVTPLKDAKQCK